MDQFVKTIGELIAYLLLIIGSVFYLRFGTALQEFNAVAIAVSAFLAVLAGSTLSIKRYHRAAHNEDDQESASQECLHWSPQAELSYELLGWLTFLAIVVLSVWLGGGLTALDLFQAATALGALLFGKRFFLRRQYS